MRLTLAPAQWAARRLKKSQPFWKGFWCIWGDEWHGWRVRPRFAITKPIARDLIDRNCGFNKVAHSTMLRWVTRYAPEFESRCNRFTRAVGTSWRVAETCIKIKAQRHYLDRAVDQHGKADDE